jgi:hypothetical protein
MMRAVIDTNVLLVANDQHAEASPDCVAACVRFLQEMQVSGITVIDDSFLILREYQNKTKLQPPKGVGDVFLKWLLRNAGNLQHVEQVSVVETSKNVFAEFPNDDLQRVFDAPDRKFVAVANAHTDKPPILQAVDCKWLDWWQGLHVNGIQVDFLCPEDACRFYRKKFPAKEIPALPALGK